MTDLEAFELSYKLLKDYFGATTNRTIRMAGEDIRDKMPMIDAHARSAR